MIVYFSSVSENTKRFVDKLDVPAERIPLRWDSDSQLVVDYKFILVTPTYGGGNDGSTVPKQVVKFLNVSQNRKNLVGVVGMGNTNFGSHFCRAADIIAEKTGVPILHKGEVLGTAEDVTTTKEKIEYHLSRA
jgi:protein involved in ribonucleotide reduction